MKPVRVALAVPRRCLSRVAPLTMHNADDPSRLCEFEIAVWTADNQDCHVLAQGRGLILGRLFQGGTSLRAADHRPYDLADGTSLAQQLTQQLWGGWIALMRDAAGRPWIARDPSPMLPIYRCETASHVLFASDVELLRRAGGTAPAVSWPDLAAHLRYPERRETRTCLAGIAEVEPGYVARLDGEAGQPLWSPWSFVRGHDNHKREQLAERLRETTITCVKAWTSGERRVAVSASGGLDSSIICAALAASGREFDCVTVATPDPSGDERAWVGHLASHFGVRVIATTFEPAQFVLENCASLGLPRPTRKAFMAVLRHLQRRACRELGADVVLDGNGGDNLLCYLHSAVPVVDRMREEGLGTGAVRTLLDMCRITQCDLATMVRAALRLWRKGGPASWHADERLLSSHYAPPMPPADCPIAEQRLPGKAAHVMLIERARNFLNELSGPCAPMRFSPLMSQPLVELCLRIPTWQWCAGGINRSLAREAFQRDLPPEIVFRQSKAGPDSVLRTVFDQNRHLMRAMLLEGSLAEHGLLDRKQVEQALGADAQHDDSIVYRLLDLTEAEAWARSWSR